MSKNLIVVESPAKAKTMTKYLGKEFACLASYGHVRDLIPKQGAVDTDNDFAMKYNLIEKNEKHVEAIAKAVKGADALYLATDPDREGESISWHLSEVLKPKVPVRRIEFHEITEDAVNDAIAHARDINQSLVRAQESRRIVDRLYGYSLSPVLWKKVQTGLSAGRVQSVAVRLIVEREEARRVFRTSTYWDLEAKLAGEGKEFPATLVRLGDGGHLVGL